MLIYLTDSLNVDSTDPQFDEIVRSIGHILTAAVEGLHIVRGDADLLSKLRLNNAISADARNFANKLYINLATLGIPSYVKGYIEVVKDNPQPKRTVGSRDVWQVDYKRFCLSGYVQRCVLIGENENDCVMFEYLHQWYVNRLRTLNPLEKVMEATVDHRGGGGSTTHNHIDNAVNEQRIAICITDTDKRYPGATIGNHSTYHECRGLHTNVATYRFEPVDMHETENLIPFDLIDNVVGSRGVPAANKAAFDCLRAHVECNDILRYFDLKNGIKKMDIAGDVIYCDFARKCYESNSSLTSLKSFDDYLAAIGDNDKVYNGLCGNVLKHVLNYIKETPVDPKTFVPIPFQEAIWSQIGQAILDWGCHDRAYDFA